MQTSERILHPPSGGSGAARAAPFFCTIYRHLPRSGPLSLTWIAIPPYHSPLLYVFNRQDFPGNPMKKTFSAKADEVRRDWYVIDAKGLVLGRLATEIARRLRGKHKPEYTPHVDTGDYIVVVNAEKVEVTGAKAVAKLYHHYSGYQSGLKTTSFEALRRKAPERIIETAVRGMLPKGPLGRTMFRKLKVYAGAAHRHTAQQPKALEI